MGTFIWLVIIYQLKASLTVENVEFNEKLNIKVVNKGCFDATNIKIEACAINDNYKFTYHFLIDREEFIAIPAKKRSAANDDYHERTFKSGELASSAKGYSDFEIEKNRLQTGESILRIRIHACHSFTGFGRLQEFQFRYDSDKKEFAKI